MGPARVFGDESAVSPVIGVLILVGVVVITASIAAAFVFGLQLFGFQTAPQAQFTFDHNESVDTSTFAGCDDSDGTIDGQLRIKHKGGDSLPAENVTIRGASTANRAPKFHECSALSSDDNVTVEDAAHVEAEADDTIRVVWTGDPDKGNLTIARWGGE